MDRPDPFADRSIYRALHAAGDLTYFRVTAGESDLHIGALKNLKGAAVRSLLDARGELEREIAARPLFLTSLRPIPPLGGEPRLINAMLKAGEAAEVGPMAAVAGAVAEYVGRALLKHSSEIIVENGGDLFLCGNRERVVAIHAGESALSGKLGIKVRPSGGLGVCTSSGTVGHSLSFGKADAALVISPDCALADAAATMLGNFVSVPEDMASALDRALALPGVTGAVIVIGGQIAVKGEVELVRI